MSAYLTTAFLGHCNDCGTRSSYGLDIEAAEEWVSAHNSNHHNPAQEPVMSTVFF